MTNKELITPDGEPLEQMGWTGKFSAARKSVGSGARLVVRGTDGDAWLENPETWWADHADQVATEDHEPVVPWPTAACYYPSVWRAGTGKVLLLEEMC